MVSYMFSSDQGNQQNEDAVFGSEEFGFVIDGASGLYQEKITNYASDAQWFSHSLAKVLRDDLTDVTKSLEVIVQEACAQLFAEYQELLTKQGKELDQEMLPNATLSLVRLQKASNQLELFQLGDSPILVESYGDVSVYDDERLAASDQRALTEMLKVAAEQQLSVKEARPFVNELLKENRRKRNTKEGYWILDPTGAGISSAKKISLPLDQISRIAIMSDGFWEAYDVFKQHQTPEKLLAALFQPTGIQEVLKSLRAAQTADPAYNVYPRFKLMDDATILLIET